jgi:hypothetical protein
LQLNRHSSLRRQHKVADPSDFAAARFHHETTAEPTAPKVYDRARSGDDWAGLASKANIKGHAEVVKLGAGDLDGRGAPAGVCAGIDLAGACGSAASADPKILMRLAGVHEFLLKVEFLDSGQVQRPGFAFSEVF